MNKLLL